MTKDAKVKKAAGMPVAAGGPQPPLADRGRPYLVGVLVALNLILAVAALRFITQSDIVSDEVEHVHVTWALNQGIMPYRDFHQNHTPLLWVVFAPLLRHLPHSVDSLILLRWVCVLAFAGTYLAGLLVWREVTGTVRLAHGLILLLLSLAVFAELDCYNFRPDPFMTLCTAYGILAAAEIRRGPLWSSLLCGAAFGAAAAFSPKMAPLCLLVPVLCLLECRRLRKWRPLWLVIPNALGFAAGFLPVVVWLASQGLFAHFRSSSAINAHLFNLRMDYILPTINAAALMTALAIAGGFVVTQIWGQRGQAQRPTSGRCPEPVPGAWAPGKAVVVAALLAWCMPILEPNHLAYNLQIFVMPAAVLGTALLAKLAEPGAWPWKLQVAVLAVALAYIAAGPAARGISPARTLGGGIPLADLQSLIDLCKSQDLTCVALAPYHPIYCRDATDVYLICDYAVATSSWIPQAGRQPYRAMWPRAIAAMESQPPSFLVTPELWQKALHDGLIDQEQYRRFQQLVRSRYQPMLAGRTSVLVRTDLLRPGR